MNEKDANRIYASMGGKQLATLDDYIARRTHKLAIDTQTLTNLVCAVKYAAQACGITLHGGFELQAAINALVELQQREGVEA
jgi:hypothetical protein